MILFFTIAALTLLQPVFTQDEDACKLDITSSRLLIVTDQHKIPLDGTLELYPYERIFVRCPPGTHHALLTEDGEQISCVDNSTVRHDRLNMTVDLNELKCSNTLPVAVQKTNETCEFGGVAVTIGFEILKKIYPAYTVCFDLEHLVPVGFKFFEEVKLVAPTPEDHFFVDSGGLYEGIDMDELYGNQKDIISKLGVADGFINDTNYLVPTPLLSNELFTYSLINKGVFDYVGTVPQWSSLQSVFFEAVFKNLNGTVYTGLAFGASEVASLPDNDNNLIELYLSDGKVAVPRWISIDAIFNGFLWRFLGYNNPVFVESDLTTELNNICETNTVLQKEKMFVGVCLTNMSEET